jgi:hypothetical protein
LRGSRNDVTVPVQTYMNKYTTEEPLCFRFPDGATGLQAVQIVIRYIQALRPQRMREIFVVLAHEALHDAWPCK